MRRLTFFLVLAAVLAPALRAQSPATPSTSAPACPSTASIDLLITAMDAAISGPANQDRTCFRALFLPDARLIPIRIGGDGAATPQILTVQGWIDSVAKNGATILAEHQLKVKTETWSHMAHLWSTYETRIDGKIAARGINSIQAIFDGKQWHLIEIVWQAQTTADPVPAQYLP